MSGGEDAWPIIIRDHIHAAIDIFLSLFVKVYRENALIFFSKVSSRSGADVREPLTSRVFEIITLQQKKLECETRDKSKVLKRKR